MLSNIEYIDKLSNKIGLRFGGFGFKSWDRKKVFTEEYHESGIVQIL